MKDKNLSAKDWCEKGIEFMRDDKFSEAIECFKKVININPKFEKVWLHMGYSYGGQYNADKAAECYKKAIEVDPNDYEAIYNLGTLTSGEIVAFSDFNGLKVPKGYTLNLTVTSGAAIDLIGNIAYFSTCQ